MSRRAAVFFLLAAAAIFAMAYVSYSAIDTLHQLDVIEADRDTWQRPADILGALELRNGNTVVDLGCGAGYFALKQSGVVGPQGKVLALDIRRLSLTFLWTRSILRGAHNIDTVATEENDPHLAANSADAILIANTYHEFRDPRGTLHHVFQALRSGGRLVIVDRSPHSSTASHEIAEDVVEMQNSSGRIHDHGSLDRVTQIVRLGVMIATSGDVRDLPKVADGASDLFKDVFVRRKHRAAWYMESQVFHSGPLSELDLVFEVRG